MGGFDNLVKKAKDVIEDRGGNEDRDETEGFGPQRRHPGSVTWV